jgi:omega-6 fatty acid desaturase (delta-12 desaturase)
MEADSNTGGDNRSRSLFQVLLPFEKADPRRASWQVFNTLVPYLLLWYVMVRALNHGAAYWIILCLALPGGLFLVRLFILFHDCAHQSFLPSKRANRRLGIFLGVLTFTPYEGWRTAHWVHHATVGNLDRRGKGDVWTMTKEEFLEAPRSKQLLYRFVRNPVVMFMLGAVFAFMVFQRIPLGKLTKKERNSIYLTNLAVFGMIAAAGLLFGFRTFFLIQLPIFFFGGALGLWLFYVQHQFEGVYWARQKDWDRLKAAMEGSSYYRLPKILQWFTGSIGFHFIHHIRPLIPNYALEASFRSDPVFQSVKPLTLFKSLRMMRLRLWDEKNGRLISFRNLKNHFKPRSIYRG